MSAEPLHALDEAILRFRVATQRPAYARAILDGLGFDGGVASLRVLRAVARLTAAEGGPSIRRVASELGVEHSTASRLVDGLDRAGLLEKRGCGEDRRQTRLRLTARGRSVLDRATARRRELVAELTASWSAEDRDTLTRLLERLAAVFDERFARP